MPRLADSAGMSYDANAHPYLKEPLKRLVKHIPELGTRRAVRDSEERALLASILLDTGCPRTNCSTMLSTSRRKRDARPWGRGLAGEGGCTSGQLAGRGRWIRLRELGCPPQIEMRETGKK